MNIRFRIKSLFHYISNKK